MFFPTISALRFQKRLKTSIKWPLQKAVKIAKAVMTAMAAKIAMAAKFTKAANTSKDGSVAKGTRKE